MQLIRDEFNQGVLIHPLYSIELACMDATVAAESHGIGANNRLEPRIMIASRFWLDRDEVHALVDHLATWLTTGSLAAPATVAEVTTELATLGTTLAATGPDMTLGRWRTIERALADLRAAMGIERDVLAGKDGR